MDSTLNHQKQSCSVEGTGRVGGLLLALLALFFFCIDIFCLISEGPDDFHRPAHIFFLLIMPCFMLVGGLYLIRRCDIRYEWNDELLIRRGWFKPTLTLPWAQITDLTFTIDHGHPVYILHDGRGGTFRIDFSVIPDDRGLESWLQQKLSPLFRRGGAAEFKLPFESYATGVGCTPGTLTLHSDRIVQQKRYEEFSIAYDEIKIVRIEPVPANERRILRYTLSDGVTDRLSFDSFYVKFPQIVLFLRDRLEKALWVDLTQPTPPADPRAAEIYHQRRIANARKSLRSSLFILMLSILIYLGFVVVSVAQGKPWLQPSLILLVFLAGGMMSLFKDLLQYRLSLRSLHRPSSK